MSLPSYASDLSDRHDDQKESWMLQPHQQVILEKMKYFEQRDQFTIVDSILHTEWSISLPMGWLADPSGSGLSWTLLQYLKQQKETTNRSDTMGDHHIIHAGLYLIGHPWIKCNGMLSATPTAAGTLLITTSRRLKKYRTLLLRCPELSTLWVHKDRIALYSMQEIQSHDLVLCSMEWSDAWIQQWGPPIQWNRIVIDHCKPILYREWADPTCHHTRYWNSNVHANFVWLIHSRDETSSPICTYLPKLPTSIIDAITIQTHPKELEQSLGIPSTYRHVIRCHAVSSMLAERGCPSRDQWLLMDSFEGSTFQCMANALPLFPRSIVLIDESRVDALDYFFQTTLPSPQRVSILPPRSIRSVDTLVEPFVILLSPSHLSGTLDLPYEQIDALFIDLQYTKSKKDFAEELQRLCRMRINRKHSMVMCRLVPWV